MKIRIISFGILASFFTFSAIGQKQGDPKDTEVWTPVPPIVSAGSTNANAPSDAIVLFGTSNNLKEWVKANDTSKPAEWTVNDGSFTVKKGTGPIRTRKHFSNYQLHLEWQIPENITGEGQGRGNSGLFLAALGSDDEGYELQILDAYNNPTYGNGQTGSIYKQTRPLANASKKPGEWQSFDVVWTAPVFDAKGKLVSHARLTAFHNGVLVQNNTVLKGGTRYIGKPFYIAHGPAPIQLQDHGDPSEPISFRNIWIRPL